MKERLKKISAKMDEYIKTKQFKLLRTLIFVLSFIVTNCISFLSGFFLNRDDNMIYKSNINAIVANQENTQTSPETYVTTLPETTPAVTTAQTTKVNVNGVVLTSKLSQISISDVEYTYSNMCTFEKRNKVYEINIPLTKKSFKITYDGTISAGLDSSKIMVSADNDARIISVILPEAHIISHDVDEDSFIITDKNDNMFNPIQSEDYTEICTSQNEVMEQQAIDDGLFDDVYNKVEESISELFNQDQTIADHYNIKFVVQKS